MYVSLHSTRVQRFAYSLAAVAGKRIPGQWAAGPLGGSRWVSGNWALKSSFACLECPLSPGRAPAPGELARAARLHSSTGRPDSSATLQTSLQPRLRAETARRRGAPSPVLGSQTCRFHDSSLLGNFATSELLRLRDAGSARPEREQDLGSAPLNVESASHWTSGALLPRLHELRFRAYWELGVLETGISGFPEGTEERRSKAPYFQWVLAAEGRR